VGLERRGLSLASLSGIAPDEPMSLAAITASELLLGVHLADEPSRAARREAWVEDVLAAFPVLPFDLRVARHHARLWADLRASGQMGGVHDLLIAATALANGCSVLTDNEDHFARIRGLAVRCPTW